MSVFQKAERKKAKARIALLGVTGGGKTKSGLKIARGLAGPNGRIAVIDTENRSASLYEGEPDIGTFDVVELDTFAPGTYVKMIHAAEAEGYDVIFIDSLSHAWMGKDGALERVDNAVKRTGGGNSFAGWRDVTPQHNELVDAMVRCKAHIIVTMRSKMEYVMEEDSRGKKVPRKIGMAPIQRDGMEFEFSVVGDMNLNNDMVVTKSRCDELNGKVFNKPGADVAKVLLDWLNKGVEEAPKPAAEPASQRHETPAPSTSAPTSKPGVDEVAVQDYKQRLAACVIKHDVVMLSADVKAKYPSGDPTRAALGKLIIAREAELPVTKDAA